MASAAVAAAALSAALAAAALAAVVVAPSVASAGSAAASVVAAMAAAAAVLGWVALFLFKTLAVCLCRPLPLLAILQRVELESIMDRAKGALFSSGLVPQ